MKTRLKMQRSLRRKAVRLVVATIGLGLTASTLSMVTTAPAVAADDASNITAPASQPSSPSANADKSNSASFGEAQTTDRQTVTRKNGTQVEIWSSVEVATEIVAKAKAAAYAGATVTADNLLEEERTASPHKVLRKLDTPNRAEALRYGTRVHGNDAAQADMRKQVRAYDKLRDRAETRVATLKLKLKHDSKGKKAKLKRQLKKAQKHLNQVKKSWKYKPLQVFTGCVRNTGRWDRLTLESFKFCVGGPDDKNAWIAIGWVPELRDTVIVGKEVRATGYEEGCHNFVYYDIPPETPDESFYVVVQNVLQIMLDVMVGYETTARLTVGGRLTCPDGSVKQDEVSEVFGFEDSVSESVKGQRKFDEILRIAEDRVRVNSSLRDHVAVKVSDEHSESLEKRLTLKCDNMGPVGEIVNPARHLIAANPNDPESTPGEARIKVVGSDPEDGANVNLTVNVSGAAELVVDAAHPVHEDVEGTNRVRYFWVRAKQPGTARITLVVTDPDGKSSQTYVNEFPVVSDDDQF